MEHSECTSLLTFSNSPRQKLSPAIGIVFYDYHVDAEQNIFSFVERNNYDMPCLKSILPSKSEAEDLNHDDDTDIR